MNSSPPDENARTHDVTEPSEMLRLVKGAVLGAMLGLLLALASRRR